MIERILSLAAWFASLALTYFWPQGIWLVLATTINLLHFRFIDWYSGVSFRDRVMAILDHDIDAQNKRISFMEKDVADVKESQIKIAASFRGRTLPG